MSFSSTIKKENVITKKESTTKKNIPLVPGKQFLPDHHPNVVSAKALLGKAYGFPGPAKYFPASNPISMERKHMEVLKKNLDRYVAAEKSDGVRYLLIIGKTPQHKSYSLLCNRRMEMYEVSLYASPKFFEGGVYDGELVWENLPNMQFERQVFLVFDAVMNQGHAVRHNDLIDRYKYVNRIFDTRDEDLLNYEPEKWDGKAAALAGTDHIVCNGNAYGLMFRSKPIYAAINLGSLVRSVDRLCHKSDGFIFTPIDEPIRTGTHPTLFKWKEDHTVDFYLVGTYKTGDWHYRVLYKDGAHASDRPISVPDKKAIFYFHVKTDVPLLQHTALYYGESSRCEFRLIGEFSCLLKKREVTITNTDTTPTNKRKRKVSATPTASNDLSTWDHYDVECVLVQWRSDKKSPNSLYTIQRTMVNIQENITIAELLRITAFRRYGICRPEMNEEESEEEKSKEEETSKEVKVKEVTVESKLADKQNNTSSVRPTKRTRKMRTT